MTDQTIDITSSLTFVRSLWDQGEELDQLSRDADKIQWGTNPGITVLGAIIGTGMIVYVCMMSRNYSYRERQALAEAERIQIARDMEEFKKMEKNRSHISKVVASYAIHLTNMTSRLSSSSHNPSADISPDKSSKNIIVPDGNDSDDIPIESITISSSSEDDLQEIEESRDNGDDDELLCMTTRSTLTIGAGNQEDDEPLSPLPSSSSIASTMTRTKMREAVTYNPCPICLEPFKAGDTVVVCSNNHDGKTPHVFHQTCSLDYILAHPDKIKAPCPMCRNVLVPSEEKQQNKGCFKHSHQSVLTLSLIHI